MEGERKMRGVGRSGVRGGEERERRAKEGSGGRESV